MSTCEIYAKMDPFVFYWLACASALAQLLNFPRSRLRLENLEAHVSCCRFQPPIRRTCHGVLKRDEAMVSITAIPNEILGRIFSSIPFQKCVLGRYSLARSFDWAAIQHPKISKTMLTPS